MNGDTCVSSSRTNPLEEGLKKKCLFRELEGCLMGLANQTRPNIANAVRVVARYTNSPREITLDNSGWHFRVCFFHE